MGEIADRVAKMRGCSLAQIVAEIERMESGELFTLEPFSETNVEAEFYERFWPDYPHKTGKPTALIAFTKARKKDSLRDIMEGLERYIFTKPADRPWLNPSTFLNQARYLDQPALVDNSPRSKTSELRNDLRHRIDSATGQGGFGAGPIRQLAHRQSVR